MASLTDAEEALRATEGKENFQRLTRLLMCGGVRLLREKFDSFYSPANLPAKLADPAVQGQLRRARTSKSEWDCLYPSPGTFGKSSDFDITLTFRLLRTICNLTQPLTGWDNLPNSTDNSLEADLARIKFYRNSVYGHNQKMEISEAEFGNLWKEISEALLRIAASISSAKRDEWKEAIDKLLHDPLTTEEQKYADELLLWYKNDMDRDMEVKDAVNKVGDDFKDKFVQVNKKLDYMTTICQSIESRLQCGQLFSSSNQPKVPGLTAATGSEMVGLTRQGQPPYGGADRTPGEHLKEDLNDPATELGSWENLCGGPLSAVTEEILETTPRPRELKLKATISEEEQFFSAHQAFTVLSQAKDEDERKRILLLKFSSDIQRCLTKVDDKFMQLLDAGRGSIEEMMKSHQEQLKQKEYFVLVTGETCSGKSSLVNLILGEELLPYSVLSTTSTICELRYGRQRKVVAHFKDKDPDTGLPTKTFPLVEPSERSAEQSYLQQIAPYIYSKRNRDKGPIYKKVELFWPHQLLEKGVVIIDSPGIGESEIMDEIVTQYLPQAFAFIYVINSGNAGGVQKDRLEKLLEEVRKVTLEGQKDSVSSKCALFVCNKWDQVPEKEIIEVQNHVVKKITKCWPGLVPESQIIYMSTKNASLAQNHGIITEEFYALMNGLRSMVLKSIEAKLEMHRKWLDYLLSRIVYQSQAFVMNASRDHEKVVRIIAVIVLRLIMIEEQQPKVMKELHRYLKACEDNAAQKLSEYLKSDDVRARFTSWTADEVPKAENSWEVTKNNIAKVLNSRLAEFIEHFDEDHQVFSDARKSLIQHFQQRYNFVEGQLRNLQGDMIIDDLGDFLESNSSDTGLSTTAKVAIGVTSPIWVPLTLVALVISAPVVGIIAIKEKLENKRRIKKFENDKCAFMAETSEDFLEFASDRKVLQVLVMEQLKEAKQCLKQIEARIPELIQANKMLFEQLRNETRSEKEIRSTYQPIQDEASEIRGHLSLFALKEIRAVDIRSDELDWKEEMSTRLGCGAFDIVYPGKIKRQGVEQTVALKVCTEILDAKNASLIMAEVDFLRKLEHPHIVKFYGTSLLVKRGTTRVILVMEKCKGSLKSHIFNHPESVPANTRNVVVIREACRWLREITAALAFMHKQGIVHRDLKLENILLSQENTVKLTDVGVSKEAKDITGTLAGTPVYIAPEVFHSRVYDSKADIYSFGIMLWEMWYGQQAFANVRGSLEVFFREVDAGYRPQPVKGKMVPLPVWKGLMEHCWSSSREERPSARRCYEQITILYQEVVKPL